MTLKGSNRVAAAIASSTHTEHGALDVMGLPSTPIAGTWYVLSHPHFSLAHPVIGGHGVTATEYIMIGQQADSF